MPLIRKFAVQGHAVPSVAHSPRGPFPLEVLAQPKMEYEEQHPDSPADFYRRGVDIEQC